MRRIERGAAGQRPRRFVDADVGGYLVAFEDEEAGEDRDEADDCLRLD